MSSSSFFCIVSPIGELLTTIHLIAVAVSIYLIAVAVSIYLIATASTVHLVATASSTTAIFVVPPTSLSVDVHPTLFLGAAPLLARKTTGSTQPELGSPDLLGFASPRRLHHSTLPQIPPPRPDSLWLHLTLVRLHCVSTLNHKTGSILMSQKAGNDKQKWSHKFLKIIFSLHYLAKVT
ncbi:hypothetical protein Bca101_075977 [Brassica carinata]